MQNLEHKKSQLLDLNLAWGYQYQDYPHGSKIPDNFEVFFFNDCPIETSILDGVVSHDLAT